jgi:hypothetical protein
MYAIVDELLVLLRDGIRLRARFLFAFSECPLAPIGAGVLWPMDSRRSIYGREPLLLFLRRLRMYVNVDELLLLRHDGIRLRERFLLAFFLLRPLASIAVSEPACLVPSCICSMFGCMTASMGCCTIGGHAIITGCIICWIAREKFLRLLIATER